MRTVQVSILTLAGLAWAAPATTEPVIPDDFGWTRGETNTAYFEWFTFEEPDGENPTTGQFPSDLPAGWSTPDVIERTGGAFITSGGNIYSFAVATDFDVFFPSYGFTDTSAVTTVIVRIETLGNELDYGSVSISEIDEDGVPVGDAASPIETTEISRETLTGGFGGTGVDTLFVFDLPGNAEDYLLEFNAAASSMSLDQLSIDTIVTVEVTEPSADVDGDGDADLDDILGFFANFGGADATDADYDGDDDEDLDDILTFFALFSAF